MTKKGSREMKINVSNSPWVSEETGISVQPRGKKISVPSEWSREVICELEGNISGRPQRQP